MIRSLVCTGFTLGLLAFAPTAFADPAPIPVRLKDHRFTPAEIVVKANQPTVLEVTNADGVAEEFDSESLKVEKVIAGGQKGIVRLRPLKPGRYPFMGEYHAKTAQGVVVAK
jgi:heme/copper-type cytochrome/quinol oxidase subunit 2